MKDIKQAGRIIGIAILTGYILDILSNFFVQPHINKIGGAFGLFSGAASQPELIGIIALMGVVSGLVAICMAAMICQLSLSKPFVLLSFIHLGLKATSFGMSGGELASYQVFRGIGDEILKHPNGETAKLIEPLWVLLTQLRDGLHFPHLLIGGTGAFVLYLIFLLSKWTPKWLSIAGLIATASQMIGVFSGILSAEVSFYFLLPLAIVHLFTSIWLIFRGFNIRVESLTQKV